MYGFNKEKLVNTLRQTHQGPARTLARRVEKIKRTQQTMT
jgi:hypothetical protein